MMEVIQKWITRATLALVILSTSSCQSPSELEFDRARAHKSAGNIDRALVHYRRTILRSEDAKMVADAAVEGAELAAQKGDLKLAMEFHRTAINSSHSAAVRLTCQKAIASIMFDKLNDYSSARKEIQRVISLETDLEEIQHYRLMLAKSHFYLKQLYQAEVETKNVIENEKSHERLFDAKLLLANIFQAAEKSAEAINAYEELVRDFPVLSRSQNVGMNLAMTFEEKMEFEKAIGVLKLIRDHYPTPEYIDLKIQRLSQRAQNLPGAKGLRK